MTTARACDGCTFCCWAFGIDDVPQPTGAFARKQPLKCCHHVCPSGCDIHREPLYPVQCHQFICSYILGDNIHRPDTFSNLLMMLNGNAEGYIPAIPTEVNITEAEELIVQTRTLLAAVVVDNRWQRRVVRLDSDNGMREASAQHTLNWIQLLYRHGIVPTMETHG